MNIEEIANKFIEAINNHDVEALCGLMTEDHTFIDSGGDVYNGIEKMRRAWGEWNPKALKGLMVDDAWLVLPGEGGTGAALSPAELDKVLPEYGSLNTAEVDFESSGTLAYLSGRYYVQRRSGPAASGVYTAVFQNLGSGWQIRSLVFF